jgi:hypothetical protein
MAPNSQGLAGILLSVWSAIGETGAMKWVIGEVGDRRSR